MARIGRTRTRSERRGERTERREQRQAVRQAARKERRDRTEGAGAGPLVVHTDIGERVRSGRRRSRREGRELRRRRAPEEARNEILAAAERVFVEFQPDQVGLKDVAREAGVSHALITHYFGTYANMVEAVLERRVHALRANILDKLKQQGSLSRPGELLEILFTSLQDPIHLRLTRWLLASERPSAAHAFALREQGLLLVAHQVAYALDPTPNRQLVERVEMALVCAVAASYGFAMGKYALAGALGREASNELDQKVQKTLGDMIQAYLRGP